MDLTLGFYLFLLKDFPQWFYGFSSIVEGVGLLIAFFISYLGFRAYKITREKRYLFFFYGFLFLGLNFLAHVMLNLLINFGYARYFLDLKYTVFVGTLFWLYYFLLIAVMLAYVSFAILYSGIKNTKNIWLIYAWAIAIGAYTLINNAEFNILTALPLSFVAVATFEKFIENRNQNTLFISSAFFSLFLFHLLGSFDKINSSIYIVRYAILLIGLVLLSIPLIKIYGRKKK